MTNVFISIDMEGIAGIAHRLQVTRGLGDFAIGRELMTKEANAAIEGSFEGGATSVVVNDSHGDMFNLLQELLDPRAEVILGSPKVPHSMMQGFGPEFDVALFLGYHAAAGTEAAVLDHTYYGRLLWDVRMNGESQTEASLNASVAGTFGVPVGLVTGDDKACAQAEKLLPGVRTVVVKQAFAEVVRDPGQFQPIRLEAPFVLEVDVLNTGIADLCSLAPGVERTGPRTLRFETDEYMQAFRCLLAFTYLGESEAPRYAGT